MPTAVCRLLYADCCMPAAVGRLLYAGSCRPAAVCRLLYAGLLADNYGDYQSENYA
jgi:hypothetical protein